MQEVGEARYSAEQESRRVGKTESEWKDQYLWKATRVERKGGNTAVLCSAVLV